MYFVSSARNLAPESERNNHTGRHALETFESRLSLVTRQLARSPYLAGDRFTAADISVTYALDLARRNIGFELGEAELAYHVRTTGRDGYQRAMAVCHDTRAWSEQVAAARAEGAKP
jgi:glutathione S-transferase